MGCTTSTAKLIGARAHVSARALCAPLSSALLNMNMHVHMHMRMCAPRTCAPRRADMNGHVVFVLANKGGSCRDVPQVVPRVCLLLALPFCSLKYVPCNRAGGSSGRVAVAQVLLLPPRADEVASLLGPKRFTCEQAAEAQSCLYVH